MLAHSKSLIVRLAYQNKIMLALGIGSSSLQSKNPSLLGRQNLATTAKSPTPFRGERPKETIIKKENKDKLKYEFEITD